MEIKELINLYRRWLWLLVGCFILGLAVGFLVSKIQSPVYEASTKALVVRGRQQSNNDMLPITDQQLAMTYMQLLKTRPVLDETEKRLGVEIDPDNVQVGLITETQIIQIKVQDRDAQKAAEIANALVQILIDRNESLQAGRFTVYEDGLNLQIAQIQEQIDELQGQIVTIDQTSIKDQSKQIQNQIIQLQSQIKTLEQEIASFPVLPSANDRASMAAKQAQITQLSSLLYLYQQIETNLTYIGKPLQGNVPDNPQVTNLQSTLNLYQQLYLNLLSNQAAVRLARAQNTPVVEQIEKAVAPKKPVRPIPLLYTALAGLVGLFVSAGAILLIDYFDDTLKSSQKIQEALGMPVIGEIPEVNAIHRIGKLSPAKKNSLLLNALGILRININRLVTQKTSRTILITSPAQGDGKTTIATNLAKAFVQSGKKVALLDADLSNPVLHSRFEVDNQKGLIDILSANLDWQEVARDVNGITLITSGGLSQSPAALLESEKMTQLLKQIQKEVDVIILDGPPLFTLDSQILVSKVGSTLLVVRQGSTITTVARAMLDQLKLMNANVLGVVLNRVPLSNAYYFDGYSRNISKDTTEDVMETVAVTQS